MGQNNRLIHHSCKHFLQFNCIQLPNTINIHLNCLLGGVGGGGLPTISNFISNLLCLVNKMCATISLLPNYSNVSEVSMD